MATASEPEEQQGMKRRREDEEPTQEQSLQPTADKNGNGGPTAVGEAAISAVRPQREEHIDEPARKRLQTDEGGDMHKKDEEEEEEAEGQEESPEERPGAAESAVSSSRGDEVPGEGLITWQNIMMIDEYPTKVLRTASDRVHCDEPVPESERELGRKLIDEFAKSIDLFHSATQGRKRALRFACPESVEVKHIEMFEQMIKQEQGRPVYQLIIYTLLQEKETKFDLEAIFLLDETKFDVSLVVGMRVSHPFIVTNAFSYVNSDGSGPSALLPKEEEVTAKTLLDAAKGYYDSFCHDKYH